MRTLIVVSAVVILCVSGMIGCAAGVRQVDATGVEQAITSEFSASFAPAEVGGVRCPDDLDYRAGLRFECSARIGDASVPVRVRVTDHAGGIEFVPTRGVVVVQTIETDLTRRLHEVYDEPNDQVAVDTRCGEPAVRVAKVGEHFDCAVVVDDSHFTERVTVSDEAGNVTYRALQ